MRLRDRHRKNRTARATYRNDPEFRALAIERSRQQRERIKANPELKSRRAEWKRRAQAKAKAEREGQKVLGPIEFTAGNSPPEISLAMVAQNWVDGGDGGDRG